MDVYTRLFIIFTKGINSDEYLEYKWSKQLKNMTDEEINNYLYKFNIYFCDVQTNGKEYCINEILNYIILKKEN